MKKRILSILLATVIAVAMMPMTALAAPNDEHNVYGDLVKVAAGVHWFYNDTLVGKALKLGYEVEATKAVVKTAVVVDKTVKTKKAVDKVKLAKAISEAKIDIADAAGGNTDVVVGLLFDQGLDKVAKAKSVVCVEKIKKETIEAIEAIIAAKKQADEMIDQAVAGITYEVPLALAEDGHVAVAAAESCEAALVAAQEAVDKILPAIEKAKLDEMAQAVVIRCNTIKHKDCTEVYTTVTEGDLQTLLDAGYKAEYKFYRSEKNADYGYIFTSKTGKYFNDKGVKGQMYFYKAELTITDADGVVVAETALDNCKYGNRKLK
ncbi:MAG: hypothetical protein MJ146_00975 [Clostridia bacterium]|nr:hypothetical protein [Clostridia bacterium]